MTDINEEKPDTNQALSEFFSGDKTKVQKIVDDLKAISIKQDPKALFEATGAIKVETNSALEEFQKLLGVKTLADEVVEEVDLAYPAGTYYGALGTTTLSQNTKGDSMVNEIFLLNYYGTPDYPKSDTRILIDKDGNVEFHKNKDGAEVSKGIKLMEFYAMQGHEYYRKNLEFKKRAFAKPFGAYDEDKHSVLWNKLNELVGVTFTFTVSYYKSPKTGKFHRNLDYDSITPYPNKRIPLQTMAKLYQHYNDLRKSEEMESDNFKTPEKSPDLPDFMKEK